MVMDAIQDGGEAALVAGIHEPPQTVRPAIGVLHGEEIDAIVAPVARAGELRHRHDFHGSDAEIPEHIEVRDDGVERPL